MSRVRFREEMKGWLSFDETDYNQALLRGRGEDMSARLRLTVDIRDLDRFLDDRSETASVSGALQCDALGGRLAIEDGSFELFGREPDHRHLRMRYRLFMRDGLGQPLTLSGFKVLEDGPNFDSWRDVTTLFAQVHAGHLGEAEEGDQTRIATGVLRVTPVALLKQLVSYRGGAGPVVIFWTFFLLQLARAYTGPPVADELPSFPRDRPAVAPPAPEWQPVPGKPELERLVVPYTADDHFTGNLHRLRRRGTPAGGTPVLLSHGAGQRAELFYGQPSGTSLAEALLDADYDVWAQNWRGSIEFPPRDYTLDEVARYDHPASVETVLGQTGSSELKAIVHCQGSISFTMAAVEGLLPEVTHVVTNCVSLHVTVTRRSRVKQLAMLPVADLLLRGADPQWGIRSPSLPAGGFAAIGGAIRSLDRCDNPVCKRTSYQYGTGRDVLLKHDNVAPDVHAWIGREHGYAPFRLINQLVKSVTAKHVVPARGEPGPKDRYVKAPQTTAAFTFVAGSLNRLFTPEGQAESYKHFDDKGSGSYKPVPVEGFGHLDTLIGIDAPKRVFPSMLEGLER